MFKYGMQLMHVFRFCTLTLSNKHTIRTPNNTVVRVKCSPPTCDWSRFQSSLLLYLTRSTVCLIIMFHFTCSSHHRKIILVSLESAWKVLYGADLWWTVRPCSGVEHTVYIEWKRQATASGTCFKALDFHVCWDMFKQGISTWNKWHFRSVENEMWFPITRS